MNIIDKDAVLAEYMTDLVKNGVHTDDLRCEFEKKCKQFNGNN